MMHRKPEFIFRERGNNSKRDTYCTFVVHFATGYISFQASLAKLIFGTDDFGVTFLISISVLKRLYAEKL